MSSALVISISVRAFLLLLLVLGCEILLVAQAVAHGGVDGRGGAAGTCSGYAVVAALAISASANDIWHFDIDIECDRHFRRVLSNS